MQKKRRQSRTGAAAEEPAEKSPVSADQSVIIIDDDSDENPRQQMPSLPALARVRGSDTFYDEDEPEMYPIKGCSFDSQSLPAGSGSENKEPFTRLLASLWASDALVEYDATAASSESDKKPEPEKARDDAVDLKIWDGDVQARLDPMFWWGVDDEEEEARRGPEEDDIDADPADLILFTSQSPCQQCGKHRLVQAPPNQAVADTPGGSMELWVCALCKVENRVKLQKEQERLLAGSYLPKQMIATIADYDKVEGITIATTRSQCSFLGAMAQNNDLLIARFSNKRKFKSVSLHEPPSPAADKETSSPRVVDEIAADKYTLSDYQDDDKHLASFRMRTKRQRLECKERWPSSWTNDGFNPTVCSSCKKGGEILSCARCGIWKHKQCWEMGVTLQLREEEVWWCKHCKKSCLQKGSVIPGGKDPTTGLSASLDLAADVIPAGFGMFSRRGQKSVMRRDTVKASQTLTDKTAVTEHLGILVTLGAQTPITEDLPAAASGPKAPEAAAGPKWYYGQCPSKSKMIMMLGKASCMAMADKHTKPGELGFSDLQRCWDCAAIFTSHAALHMHVASGCRNWSNSILFRT